MISRRVDRVAWIIPTRPLNYPRKDLFLNKGTQTKYQQKSNICHVQMKIASVSKVGNDLYFWMEWGCGGVCFHDGHHCCLSVVEWNYDSALFVQDTGVIEITSLKDNLDRVLMTFVTGHYDYEF